MKNKLFVFVLIFVLTPCWVVAQEVITNESGRKIVVDANGNWRYFQVDSNTTNTGDAKFRVPKKDAYENEQRLADSRQLEQQLALLLIKNRVEMIDLQIALGDNSSNSVIRLKEQLEGTELKILQLETQLQEAKLRTAFLQKIGNLPQTSYARKLKKWEHDHPFNTTPAIPNSEKLTSTDGHFANDIANGILLLPPKLPCEAGYQSDDPLAKKFRWETAPSSFFTHTDVAVEQQFGKCDFIECTAYLAAFEGGVKQLNLEIAVASDKAPQIFGTLLHNELLEVQLLSGETVRLFNTLPSNGQWLAAQGTFVFKGRYALGIREEKLLRSSEVDKVLVRWSLVQELFEVFETDFFIRHFNCLAAVLPKVK